MIAASPKINVKKFFQQLLYSKGIKKLIFWA